MPRVEGEAKQITNVRDFVNIVESASRSSNTSGQMYSRRNPIEGQKTHRHTQPFVE